MTVLLHPRAEHLRKVVLGMLLRRRRLCVEETTVELLA
jgi:hypothetical protein